MPFYEYSCPSCGSEKEVLHGIHAKPEILCDACDGEVMRRLVSAAGFRLKGGGWYETDFKSDKRRNVAGDGEGASKGADSAPAASSDGKDKVADKPAAKDKAADKPATKSATSDGKSGSAATAG
jgi:putative FmdB family regulatory protein